MTSISQPRYGPTGRFLSREESSDLAKRVRKFALGGGLTTLQISSSWRGNIRWARNQTTTCGDVRDNIIRIGRIVQGAGTAVTTNQISDHFLEASVRRAERLLQKQNEQAEAEFQTFYIEPFKEPTLWFDRTYQLQAEERAETMRKLVKPAEAAGMLSAGYIEVSATGQAILNEGTPELYFPFTRAQYSVTVRDPRGLGSGWAGVDWSDWGRIDAEKISEVALDKCLRSRNPVAIEPGRYTAVLEPQAVCDLLMPMVRSLDRGTAENDLQSPFNLERNFSKIGLQIVDRRITIGTDPMDPELGYPPFMLNGDVYHGVNWIENGILKELPYSRNPYAIQLLGKNSGLPNPMAFRMSGDASNIDTMISNTKRGVLVTRFSNIGVLDKASLLLTGVTRDGFWLIENGKISKSIKNFRITESPLVALNNVLELGVPQRVFQPGAPTVVPPLRIQDFSFTSMTDAI